MLPTIRWTATAALGLTLLVSGLTTGTERATATTDLSDSTGFSHNSCVQARIDSSVAVNDDVFGSRILTIEDWRIDLKQGWRHEHPRDPRLTLIYSGGGWLIPDDTADVSVAVDLLIEWTAANPDVGGRTLSSGWAESATTKRLGVATCLFHLSNDPRLVSVIEELVAANLDPNRYYGPPRFAAHNHGVMANRALLGAGEELGRSDWIDTALDRLRLQLDQAFDECGMSFEQASSYQLLKATMWENLIDRIEAHDPQFAQVVARTARTVRSTGDRLARPDGVVEAIGDGHIRFIEHTSAPTSDSLWCPDTGWSSRTTVTADLVQHTLTRFGPGTRFHGHADKGALTWWVGTPDRDGTPVLSDRGLSGKVRDENYAYSTGTQGHSTLLWNGGSNLRLSGSERSRGTTHHIVLKGKNRHGSWTRRISSTADQPVLVVTDRITRRASRSPASQIFTLAPEWSPVGDGRYRTDDGWILDVSCSARGGRARVSNRSVEHYADPAGVQQAYSAWCTATPRGRGAVKITSTLTVSR